MNRDDIIRLAREAQGTSIPSLNNETIHFGFLTEELERFAALVAAHERERFMDRDEGECASCVDRKCTTGPECVALSNPVTPWEVTCARCGKVGLSSEFEVEEGDEWECRTCNDRENAREAAAIRAWGKSHDPR